MTDSMEVLGWTLLHFCWQAAAIALVYRVVEIALPAKTRSNVRYGLALAALLSMFAVSLATFAYEETRGANGMTTQASTPKVAQQVRDEFSALPALGVGMMTHSEIGRASCRERVFNWV